MKQTSRVTLASTLLLAACLALSGCAASRSPQSIPNLWEVQKRIDDYITSGRYEAECASVAAKARGYLEERAKAGGKLAIVLDIDETSLSNWPAYKLNGYARITSGECDLEKGPCNIRAWYALGKSAPIRPTLELARRARELGVAVFFVSGRPSILREVTERNLKEAGFVWDGLILMPEGMKFASAAYFKEPERKKLADQGYTILFSMGDQYSDLTGGYAERTFKMPNPVYVLP